MAFFPLFIDLSGKDILVVGAGRVGSRRIETLVSFDAAVTVVSLTASETVEKLAKERKIKLFKNDYSTFRSENFNEVKNCFSAPFYMVLSATGDLLADEQAASDARRSGAFVNVAGEKTESDFYFPGIAKTGIITAGVIAGGKDHHMAKRATEEVDAFLQKTFPDRNSRSR